MDPGRFAQSPLASPGIASPAAPPSPRAGPGSPPPCSGRAVRPAPVRAPRRPPPVASEPGANQPPNVPAWMQEPGAPSSEYGERAPQEQGVVRFAPAPDVSFSPLAAIPGTLTPNGLFYEVHYGGIPAVDPAEHRLLVHGLVERPTLFTIDDLKRFPSVSRTTSWSARATRSPSGRWSTSGRRSRDRTA